MQKRINTKERTQARTEEAIQNLEDLRLYTITEIEKILGVTHKTVENYIKGGKLKAVKIGGKWKVTEDTLRRFVNGE